MSRGLSDICPIVMIVLSGALQIVSIQIRPKDYLLSSEAKQIFWPDKLVYFLIIYQNFFYFRKYYF